MIAVETLAERLARGEHLTAQEGEALLATTDLIAIGMLGDQVRRQLHGARTTFVRVLEVHVDAPAGELPPRFNGGELRIVGTPQSRAAAVSAVRSAVARGRGVPVLGFSLADLWNPAGREDEFAATCRSLRDAGLAGIAELPLDRLEDAAPAVDAARRAGLQVVRLTIEALLETARIQALTRARDLQRSLGGFRSFAPLPRTTPGDVPTTGYDDVKLVALARVMVTEIPSIQVDWRLHGPKLAQVALTVGADDVDGIEAVDEGTLGTRRSARAEILGNIRAAGLEPVERDGLFAERG